MGPNLRAILRILWDYPRQVVFGALCLLAVDAGQLVVPLILRAVIDRIADGSASESWLAWNAAGLLGLSFLIGLFRFLWRHLFFVAARGAELDLRARLYAHALRLEAERAAETPPGELMALATNDVESVRMALAMGLVAGFDATVFALFALLAMFSLDAVTAAVAVLPLPPLGFIMWRSLRLVYGRWDRLQESFQHLTERARESIAGVRVLKAFAAEEASLGRFSAESREYFDRYMAYVQIDSLFRPTVMLHTGASMAVLLGLGGLRVIDGTISIGTFTALMSYVAMLAWPMVAAGWMAALLQRAAASMGRIRTFLNHETEPEVPADRELLSGAPDVLLKGLTFAYAGRKRPALADLELSLSAGSSLGVVGEIGSGKSTLVKLLTGALPAPPGALWIAGHDAHSLPLGALRRAVAWVPQEAFLFSATIALNLRLGDPTASDAQLLDACRKAAFDEELKAFPDGLDTLLGERGVTLSGGQRQRLTLARALLKPAPILVLDDTLSAVDHATERRIIQGLRQATSGRSLIVISHRLSAVRDLDQIAVLEAGRIADRGTHAELSARPGLYRRLVALQDLAEMAS